MFDIARAFAKAALSREDDMHRGRVWGALEPLLRDDLRGDRCSVAVFQGVRGAWETTSAPVCSSPYTPWNGCNAPIPRPTKEPREDRASELCGTFLSNEDGRSSRSRLRRYGATSLLRGQCPCRTRHRGQDVPSER